MEYGLGQDRIMSDTWAPTDQNNLTLFLSRNLTAIINTHPRVCVATHNWTPRAAGCLIVKSDFELEELQSTHTPTDVYSHESHREPNRASLILDQA